MVLSFLKGGIAMIELPETYVLSAQINQQLSGKRVKDVLVNSYPHKFAWYSGDSKNWDKYGYLTDIYREKLVGKNVTKANPNGGDTEIICEDQLLIISTPIKYHEVGKLPAKHQLLVKFDDNTHISCTVQMWGAMLCFSLTDKENSQPPDPLTDAFDEDYFETLWTNTKPGLSSKAFLATEQRIPGLGNGVLQDILFNAKIHPKRKLQTMDDEDMQDLFSSVKATLKDMKELGGRDTEKDLFGQNGGYRTILSKNTISKPCSVCGWDLIRQAYLGGNIYFCPVCQPL